MMLVFKKRPICWICENPAHTRATIDEACSAYLGVQACTRCSTRHYLWVKEQFPFFSYVPEVDGDPKWKVDGREEVRRLYWVELLAKKLEKMALRSRPRP